MKFFFFFFDNIKHKYNILILYFKYLKCFLTFILTIIMEIFPSINDHDRNDRSIISSFLPLCVCTFYNVQQAILTILMRISLNNPPTGSHSLKPVNSAVLRGEYVNIQQRVSDVTTFRCYKTRQMFNERTSRKRRNKL